MRTCVECGERAMSKTALLCKRHNEASRGTIDKSISEIPDSALCVLVGRAYAAMTKETKSLETEQMARLYFALQGRSLVDELKAVGVRVQIAAEAV